MIAPVVPSMSVDDIYAVDRHRVDLGDIDALAASIQEVGLLQPIVVSSGGRLIAGGRRLEAVKRLGWPDVPVHVAETLTDASELLRAERDENTVRKDFLPTEAAALGMALEEIYRPAATANREANLRRGSESPTGSGEPIGRTYEIAAPAVGLSPATYKRIKAVVKDAADESLPQERREAARAAADAMDEGAPVTPTYEMYRAEVHVPSPADLPSERAVTVANAHARRIRKFASTLSGQVAGAASLDINAVRAVLGEDERKQLSQEISAAIAGLRTLNRDLEHGR